MSMIILVNGRWEHRDPDRKAFGGMAKDQETYDRETERYAELTGKYKHYCPDWDFMAIDETCPEFDACVCFGWEPL